MIRKIFLGLTLLILLLGVGAALNYRVRQEGVRRKITAGSDQTNAEALPALGSVRSLSILPLIDLYPSRPELMGETGVSYLIRTENSTILFDFGFNAENTDPSPLEHNLQSLGLSLAEVDTVVLSHFHPDHVGGMKWWQEKTFSQGFQPFDFEGKTGYVPVELSYPSLKLFVGEYPQKVAQGVGTSGTLLFEQPMPISLLTSEGQEQILGVVVEGYGLVLITGCGHPGVARMVARAQTVFEQPVVGLIGGLHYPQSDGRDIQPQIDFLKGLDLKLLAVSAHDSSPQAIKAISDQVGEAVQPVEVGREIQVAP